MSDDAIEILNLLYIYAERIDSGHFAGAAELFANADVTVGGNTWHGAAPILDFWRKRLRLQPDGTPRCKHITTNPILEFAADRKSATVRSTYLVIQATENLPLQVITSGRYHDGFERVEGRWRFASRAYAPMDLVGDTSDYFLS